MAVTFWTSASTALPSTPRTTGRSSVSAMLGGALAGMDLTSLQAACAPWEASEMQSWGMVVEAFNREESYWSSTSASNESYWAF